MTVQGGERIPSPNLPVFKSEGRSEDEKGRCSGQFQVSNMAFSRQSQTTAIDIGRLHQIVSTRLQQDSRLFLTRIFKNLSRVTRGSS